MSQAIHTRAREVFFEAVELPAEDRAAYLDGACGDDAELRADVESLLAHHSPDSIFREAKPAEKPSVVAPASRGAKIASGYGRAFASRRSRLIWTLAAAAMLVALGNLTHSRIERAMLEIRADELKRVLDAGLQSLELWAESRKAQADLLAEDPRLLPLVEELVEIGDGDQVMSVTEALKEAPARQGLLELSESFDEKTGANTGLVVLNVRGVVLFTINNRETGMTLIGTGLAYLSEPLAGRSIALRPHRIEDFVGVDDTGTMYTYIFTPVRNASGRVIAVLVTGNTAYGPGSISSILEVSQLGDSGETYAFDDDGLMLSESRFTDQLRRVGLAPSAIEQGREWDANAQLNVQVRDPGGDLVRGHVPELEVGARPLTRLAALAIAARDKTDRDELQGTVLEPYRSYRGVEVIGTWQWLPDLGFGVATEIEADEALAPLRYVELIFGVLFVLLCVFVLSTLFSTFSVARLRGRVRELKELGPYRLISPIAEGGMGVVYLAEHSLLKRRTAVKVLSGELSKQNISRFEREVSLASRLTHPNTIEIYDYGRTPEGIFYYAMEYVDGPTLAELVTHFGPSSPARVVHILRQLCASLGEAHREGLVHRDIKPQNVMLCVRGGDHDVVKVLDFGLVKDVTAAEYDELSRGINIGGTPLYMAPERLTSPKRLDARVDVYSMGCVAYYLLAGRPVFEPADHLDLLDKIINEVPRPLSEVCSRTIPTDLIDLITACLAKDPEDRPGTVFAVMELLDALSDVSRWTEEHAARWWRDAYRKPGLA